MNESSDIYKELTKLTVKDFPKFKINSIYDLGTYYVVSLIPNGMKQTDDSFICDPYHKIDKKSGKISGFTPMMDIKAFKKALKDPIYMANNT